MPLNLFTLASTLLFASLFYFTPLAAQTPGTIKVGSELDFYPYAYANEKGEPAGFSVDLIRAVADTVDLKIEIKAGPWDKIWNELVEGKIDLLPLVGKLPDRAAVIEFSTPHTGTSDAFFVREGQPPLTSIESAQNKQIVVMKSDVAHHKLLEHRFPGEIVTVPTITDGLKLVAEGKHDAFLGPLHMSTLAIKDHDIRGLVAGEPVQDYLRIQAFAVKKGDFELLSKLNQGLEIIKSNGEYARIYDKWFSPKRTLDRYLNIVYVAVGIGALLIILFVALMARRRRNDSPAI